MDRIIRIYVWLFPRHNWTYNTAEDKRTCACCEREEAYELGGGAASGMWVCMVSGDRASHIRTLAASPPRLISQGKFNAALARWRKVVTGGRV
jgi:hypothetical protein